MFTKATVTERGAILLGRSVACDAFDPSKPLRVVTHAHADHMNGLRQSLRNSEKVLMTKATKDLIGVLESTRCLAGGNVETLNYGKTMVYEDEQITFFRADHILGAAQVQVEDAEGFRIVNTGDFRIEDTPVLPADILVMEATYGSPWCRRAFAKEVKNQLVSIVEKGLKHGTVYIFGYHGKLQEVMQILSMKGLEVPFVVPERVFHVSKVCEEHGMNVGSLMLSDTKEGREMLETNSTCVAFHHTSSKNRIHENAFQITVSGWEFNSALHEVGDKEYIIALSDHSDFYELIEYVKQSKPKLVITDGFRAAHAQTLAKEIHKRFEIPAVALPER